MKKLLLALAILVTSVAGFAQKYTRDVNVLPAKAQTFIKNNFKKDINHIKVENKTFGKKEFDVILNNGTEIEFDHDGNWKSIDCGNSAVPSSVVPVQITNYVNQNYKGQKIVEIEIERNKYDVQLSNGLDLEFDRSGRFLRIDD